MADAKISALTGATTPLGGTEVLPIVQSGSTKKVAISDLTAGRDVSAGSLELTTGGINVIASEAYSTLRSSGGIGSNARVRYRAVYSGGGSGYGGSFELETRTASNVYNTGAFTVTDEGNVSTTGNFVIGTSGKGIDFTQDPNPAGMTSELLDDYEEGGFAATLLFGGTPIESYNAQGGFYTKIGNTVHFTIFIQVRTKGAATGAVTVGGLPFTSSSTNSRKYSVNVTGQNLTLLTGALFGVMDENSTSVAVYQSDASGGAALTDAAFADFSSDNLIVTGTYQV